MAKKLRYPMLKSVHNPRHLLNSPGLFKDCRRLIRCWGTNKLGVFCEFVIVEIPIRMTSTINVPESGCLSPNAICSSVNYFFPIENQLGRKMHGLPHSHLCEYPARLTR